MKHTFLLPVVALFTLASAPAVHAQLITSVSSTAPATDVAISFTTANYSATSVNTVGMGWKGDTGSRRDMGQTFTTTTSFLLDRITVQLQFVGTSAPGANYSLSLYEFPSAGSLTASSTVGTWTGTLPGSSTLAPATYTFSNGTVGPFLTFDMPNVTLSASTTYGFVLSFTTLASNESLNFWTKGGGAYAGGQQIQTGTAGATTFTSSGNDVLFYVQAVPEGSTFAMVLGGALLLFWVRRLRRTASPASR
ncbi:PEP-CTERM protein-sorting domain-containing protein [Terrimicrobium sacchariphilum]|uniref:PEP-CTERM protein-sorting domain-containing protein n=1 Tax=Terrimicrobium sacchariphilum TaxID=690879 RepID=A0A146G748_TERSA|nr:hypothetical protein [Terrimicrobium sacchariphilum]GAT32727.1 PEP-CTERM protein-sorting domain-containing protein [Terrimicrobium sacchariphilum]